MQHKIRILEPLKDHSFCQTSNDLLFRLAPDLAKKKLHYQVITQSAQELQDVLNSPAVSMAPYLMGEEQSGLATKISIYSERGESREQIRLLYMNEEALRVWEAMGRRPTRVGAMHRPPRTAQLCFGVPFSE
jgi:hypothetical protein